MRKAEEVLTKFSLTEKLIFYSLAVIFSLGALSALFSVSESFMVNVPSYNGKLTEGIVGLPRFVNPLLAISDADRDLSALIYSGLLKATAEGTLVPDLAESYSISEDGLSYTFSLKPSITFHDNVPITADDIVFTIAKAQDPTLKSPKRPNWEGVHVEKIDDWHVKFTLKQPYSSFLENLTLGILPKHIWKDVDMEQFPFSQFNVEPVGSGPFKFRNAGRTATGIPLYYQMESFSHYAFGRPFIKNLTIRFFQSNKELMTAYLNGAIDNLSGIAPEQARELKNSGARVEQTPLPRIFAVFFNPNLAPVLANKEVRQALNILIDKERIVSEILAGYGIEIDSPIPPNLLPPKNDRPDIAAFNEKDRMEKAKKILTDAKWKWNASKGVFEKAKSKKETVSLSFSMSTSNSPELKAVAEMLKQMWQKIGIKVELKFFDIGELNQDVIRSRKYDALLFGEIIGRDLDLFAFWHSSQRNDPGLNVALYTNPKADKLLEEARSISAPDKRIEKYQKFEAEVKNDLPAIFLYSPDYLYLIAKNLGGFSIGHVTIPADRFLSIEKWYTETDRVWKIFLEK